MIGQLEQANLRAALKKGWTKRCAGRGIGTTWTQVDSTIPSVAKARCIAVVMIRNRTRNRGKLNEGLLHRLATARCRYCCDTPFSKISDL